MPAVINTNIMSLNSQRSLMGAERSLATAMERLSTGLRINSAKDDAAGLAIAERMTGQIRGLNQAVRNANDGVSLLQTAEGALNEITSNLQRVRELAVQSASDSNTSVDRSALDAEVQQLLSEIDRIAEQTEFNGSKLLNGDFTSATFQVGANSGQSITVSSLIDANLAAIGDISYATTSSAAMTGLTLTAVAAGDSISIQDADGLAVDLGALDAATSDVDRARQVVDAVNNIASQTGVNAHYDETNSTIVLTSDHDIVVDAGSGAADDGSATGFDVTGGALTTTATTTDGIGGLNVTTLSDADKAIRQVDAALATINSTRAGMGALQSRFESAVNSLQTTSENLSAARSRIQDADFAAETAALTRAQILQQAGTAMLAQANAAPQGVLSLLQ